VARNPSIGNPAPYAVESILEGLNATTALNEIRAAGGGISTQSWYRAYGEASAALANLTDVSGLDLFATPGRDQFVTWTAGKEPGFVYQFGIDVVDPETGLIMTIPHTVISPTIISVGQAIGQAIGDLALAPAGGTVPGQFVAPSTVDLLAMTGGQG
jgi:hypothetical protein